jgi:release factor glutamine methyltransferase
LLRYSKGLFVFHLVSNYVFLQEHFSLIMNKIKDIYDKLVSEIWFYNKEEAREIAFLLLQKQWNISRTDLIIGETENSLDDLGFYIERINQGEPIQYILGETWFRDRKFLVNPSVLIPRPETEELIDKVNALKPKSILDLGTGSGCISISLALEMPDSELYAIDISEGAIHTAKQNAELNNAKVHFSTGNILHFENPFDIDTFDLIISNPPYVKENEKSEMRKNVLDFEPHLALFVTEEDPLIFYRSIGEIGLKFLSRKGSIWVEINSYLGKETEALFKDLGYSHTRLLKDFFGKDRYLEIRI